MSRLIAGILCLSGALMAAGPSFAKENCSRASLQSAVDSYVGAQTKGDPSGLKLASASKYAENHKDADIKTGILATPLKIDFKHSLLDTETCETFTEIISNNAEHPYVLGVHLTLSGDKIAAIDSVVTDKDDWMFNAESTLKHMSAETWGVIPRAERSDRNALLAAANAYFDVFFDKSVQVPWGTPCNRIEGGMYIGKGLPTDSCNVGVPSNLKITGRRFVVDEDIGAVVGLVTFGRNLPDSHLFRLEGGKIRYIHALTVCPDTPNCGFSASGARPRPPGAGAQDAQAPVGAPRPATTP